MPVSSLSADANIVYAVDRSLAIVAFNAGYGGNDVGIDAAAFLKRWGVGARVLDAMTPDLRPFYRQLFDRAFAGEVIEHRYQCPLPDRYREFRMRLLPDPRRETVLVEHALALERDLPGLDLDDAAIRARYQRDGVIVQCCHCRKTRRNVGEDVWDWVGALVAHPWPAVSHGLCPVCLDYYYPVSTD